MIDVPVIEPTPCEPYPDDTEIKSVGLGACPECNSWSCWRQYREWADKAGVSTARRPSISIAEVPVELGRDQNIVQVKIKAPGIVRAAAFWLQTPAVLGSASMRAVEKVAQPLLYVECDPNGELQERVFLFQPSGAAFRPRDGFALRYLTTIVGQVAMHVFEIVSVVS